ncbi:hypothetical protein [Stieleria neptunia]|nr:hypothetical protein [Stieleria neptunia]
MLVRTLQTIALLTVASVIALVIYCGSIGIRSVDDFHDYRAMQSVDDPIVVALAEETLTAGATTQEMLAIASPQWSESYGRCVVYGFTPERSYDHQTIVTVDGRVASARVGSCTWQWSFFDNTPIGVAEAVGHVRGLRDTMERMPEYAHYMQPLLDEQLDILGVHVNVTNEEAVLSVATEPGLQDFTNGKSILPAR